MRIESMFITENVSADQRLPPRQSMLFLFQLGQISCHLSATDTIVLRSLSLREANYLYVTGAAVC